jgi:hypothetical protein
MCEEFQRREITKRSVVVEQVIEDFTVIFYILPSFVKENPFYW